MGIDIQIYLTEVSPSSSFKLHSPHSLVFPPFSRYFLARNVLSSPAPPPLVIFNSLFPRLDAKKTVTYTGSNYRGRRLCSEKFASFFSLRVFFLKRKQQLSFSTLTSVFSCTFDPPNEKLWRPRDFTFSFANETSN